MRIPRIYQNIELTVGNSISLDQAACHHLGRVLRLKNNNQIILFNGQGGEYLASLSLQGKKLFAEIIQFIDTCTESPLQITLLQGISKGDRMDFAIQKAVELGVSHIVPLICQRTVVNLKQERMEKKLNHWQGIIINACEQSGRTSIPELLPAVKLIDYLRLASSTDEVKLTLDPRSSTGIHQLNNSNDRFSLLIGPEGGLSQEEIELAHQHGFTGIQMGPRVLRTETAALAAISVLQSQWGDFKC